MNVSRQAISRRKNGTSQPDAENILQISKLFYVTTDYLLNDDYESDGDIPAVKSATEEKETLFLKKKHLHLVAAICFTIAAICAPMAVADHTNDTQLAISDFTLALCSGNAIAQFLLYLKKR